MKENESELYKKLKEMYGDAPAEEKIQLLRNETMRTTSMAHGFSILLLKELEDYTKAELPQNLIEDTKKIIQYLDETRAVIFAFSDK